MASCGFLSSDSFQISTLRDSRTASQCKLPVHHNSLVYKSTKDNQIIIWRTHIQNTIPNIHKGTFLKLTASFPPESRPFGPQKERRIVFQQSTFKCENVSFRERICWGGDIDWVMILSWLGSQKSAKLSWNHRTQCLAYQAFTKSWLNIQQVTRVSLGKRNPSQVLSNKLLCGIPLKTDPLIETHTHTYV